MHVILFTNYLCSIFFQARRVLRLVKQLREKHQCHSNDDHSIDYDSNSSSSSRNGCESGKGGSTSTSTSSNGRYSCKCRYSCMCTWQEVIADLELSIQLSCVRRYGQGCRVIL